MRSLFHHVVAEKLHGVNAVVSGFGNMDRQISGVARIADHEVVHADDSACRIIEAGSDAGTEKGRDDTMVPCGVEFSRGKYDPLSFLVNFYSHRPGAMVDS